MLGKISHSGQHITLVEESANYGQIGEKDSSRSNFLTEQEEAV